MTSRKTAFRFLTAFFFSYLYRFVILFRHLLKLINLGNFNIIRRCDNAATLSLLIFAKYGLELLDLDPKGTSTLSTTCQSTLSLQKCRLSDGVYI